MVCKYLTNYPATQALQALDADRLPAPEELKRARLLRQTQQVSPYKKQRTVFDLSDLISHIKPVEESIAFPIIEWSYDDDTLYSNNGSIRSNIVGQLSSTATQKESASRRAGQRRSSSVHLGGKRPYGKSLARSRDKDVCLVSLLGHTISSQAFSDDCMSALNDSVFSLGSSLQDDNEEPYASAHGTTNESICLAFSQILA